MYEQILFMHSWLRWVVLGSLVSALATSIYKWIKKEPFSDDGFIWAINQIYGTQILFGLTLWIAVSPIVRSAILNPKLILRTPLLFFLVIRHPLSMLLAFGVFHMGRARARRAPPIQRPKIYCLALGVALLVVLSAIPWPSLTYGRNLFRWWS